MLSYDVPVDIVCTPTHTIHVERKLPTPSGIMWDKLSPQKIMVVQALGELKDCHVRRSRLVESSGTTLEYPKRQ